MRHAFQNGAAWGSLVGRPLGLGSVGGMSWAARQTARSPMSWPSTSGGWVRCQGGAVGRTQLQGFVGDALLEVVYPMGEPVEVVTRLRVLT